MEGDSWIVLGARKPNLVLKLNLCYVFFWLFSSYQDKLFSRPRKKGVLHDNHLYHVSGVKEVGRIQNVGQFSSVQSLSCVWLFETPWTAARQASLPITNSQSLLKLVSIESMMPPNHLILCPPLLLLPSIFYSIRVFSTESVLRIRWPKFWSFSFSICPSDEYSGLISLRMDSLYLLAVQGTLKNLLQHHSSKGSILQCSAFFYNPTLTSIHD